MIAIILESDLEIGLDEERGRDFGQFSTFSLFHNCVNVFACDLIDNIDSIRDK